MTGLFKSVAELNAQTELFDDPNRPDDDRSGPFVIIRDDFYREPMEIRQTALTHDFFQFSPPLPEQVGDAIASARDDLSPAWVSTSLLRYRGGTVASPEPGFRHATREVREALADIVGEDVSVDTWDEMGDWWNGAFHVLYENWRDGAIHHHYKEGDVARHGWSGIVYLSPDAPVESGTTIWRERSSGLCIASKGAKFDTDESGFGLALQVENRFNRLVLLRENVLHRAENGFGTTPGDGRMTQSFFFHSERRQPTE